MIENIANMIPRLSHNLHKGQMGRIAIVGGSKEYTGAPYFSAISCLYCGADLVHVICSASSAPVIKSYSPDLIIHPVLDGILADATKCMDKVHAITFGPGLGLNENVENAIKLIDYCRQSNKPIVIDADALHIITQNPSLIEGYEKTILTPNSVEFSRLYYSVFSSHSNSSDAKDATRSLAEKLGVTIVHKGPADIISNGQITILCEEQGSPRRCGGQGDILSGTMSVFNYWFHQSIDNNKNLMLTATIGAAFAACSLTRRCSQLAYTKYGRSMVTTQMLPEIHSAFDQLFSKTPYT
ncbi:ATP-dependent (S)-NAD(P)H-hydrate dehydratase [Schistosoma japonicum]|uniref:ATP-dependent (S)-NAD(P)H-hydrate dehydratase n=1 Tax=Schistosoma japonicum TaxID=6182 RepID=A0A4Z2D1F1_SCHJA|nr:ATP-dependent [Schistosoma japonicum]KAH8876725.1 ATP-dependent [Schistosoma japonicum]KAH8876727.1 ATP-dependent [Schistosoma japonicum]KAH8876728.1 ATP-dependent [Schistosoma japonicum]KAH8876729.1 ATP-dependent [Schistosoma japonicum]